MRNVIVPLLDRSYTIRIGPALLRQVGRQARLLSLGDRCAVFTDSNVGPLFAQTVVESLATTGIEAVTMTVPAGETSKNLRRVESCYEQLAANRIDRKNFIIALGGGVIGDLAGYVAATWLRGIPFVQVPTTLLAQVDSSVGGKTGVNLKAGKNLVGVFHQPRIVLCDLDTLKTLPEREFKSGLAEIIKYGVIHDASLFRLLENRMPAILKREPETLSRVIARCCAIKADVVGQDETEAGLRAILNFGHTIGHAIEAVSRYGKYLHGEAIAIGMAAAASISSELKGLPENEVLRITSCLEKAGLPVHLKLNTAARQRLLQAMTLDKKATAGQARFVLANRIGQVEFGCIVRQQVVERALEELG